MDTLRIGLRVEPVNRALFDQMAALRGRTERAEVEAGGLGMLHLLTVRDSEWDAYMNAYRFVLKNGLVRVCLTDARRTARQGKAWNVTVQYSAFGLAVVGLERLWQETKAWIESAVGTISATLISRMDLKVDVAGWAIKRSTLRSMVTRGRQKREYFPEVKASRR